MRWSFMTNYRTFKPRLTPASHCKCLSRPTLVRDSTPSSSASSSRSLIQRDHYKAMNQMESDVIIDRNNMFIGSNISISLPNYLTLPKPYDRILDMNLERQSVVFEVVLGRDLGIQITQGDNIPLIGDVLPGSKAALSGIQKGDYIVSTSATAGDSMWTHNTVDGVKSALNTRFVMSKEVTIRFERPLNAIPSEIVEQIHVPYQYVVRVKRPIGLHVVEGVLPVDPERDEPAGRSVLVQYIKPDLGAYKSKRIEVGDQIIAMSASWGDRLWAVNSVESFVVGVKMRTDKQLSFKLRRMVPLAVYSGQLLGRQQRVERTTNLKSIKETTTTSQGSPDSFLSPSSYVSIADLADRIQNASSLLALWKYVRESGEGKVLNAYNINKVMTTALRLERPDIAVDAFESSFGFFHDPIPNPAKALIRSIILEEDSNQWAYRSVADNGMKSRLAVPLAPNNFVATTAVKAYGRLNEPSKALALLPWLESGGNGVGAAVAPDVYFMSALLYVCAKEKRLAEAERLFWQDIPRRNLTYTIATINSLMFMYAKLNRPEDALKVYDLAKGLGIQCTVVTYGVLIKALMKSGKKKLEEASFEILHSLPSMGITPGVEVYNQFFEHYSKTHNYRQAKSILRLMSLSSPKVKPDSVSYGYLINCFADSKKPRSAIAAFHQMTKRRIAPNAYTFMGVLKALSHIRDGLSAVQVLSEMRDRGVMPDKKHYSMAMFTCLTAGQFAIAESIFASYLRTVSEKPDTALYTLLLRAYLQQKKWVEANKLFAQMTEGGDSMCVANSQTINCMLQFQVRNERWKEAGDTFDWAVRNKDVLGLQLALPSSIFTALSFALSSYSAHASRVHQEDVEAKSLYEGGGSKSDLSSRDYGYYDETPLTPPSKEALRFLLDCVSRLSGERGVAIPESFYTELLKGLVLEGITPYARKLLELRSSGQIKVKTDDKKKLAEIEGLAVRALNKMAGISARENAITLGHLVEGRELRSVAAEEVGYEYEGFASPPVDESDDEEEEFQ